MKTAKVVKTDRNTAGGDTFHVNIDGVVKTLCFRRKRKNTAVRCTKPAGYDTWHLGTGACKFHGGEAGRQPAMKTARHAHATRARLQESIDKYIQMDRASLLDMTHELAATRAMFDEFLEHYPDPSDENYGIAFHRFQSAIGTLGTLVEKISKIESRNTITTAQVLYLRATVADILMKYIVEPDLRMLAARELANRMGGELSMQFEHYETPSVIEGQYADD